MMQSVCQLVRLSMQIDDKNLVRLIFSQENSFHSLPINPEMSRLFLLAILQIVASEINMNLHVQLQMSVCIQVTIVVFSGEDPSTSRSGKTFSNSLTHRQKVSNLK